MEDLGQSGTFNQPSIIPSTLGHKSATSGTLGTNLINSIVSEPHYPPSDSDDDIILAPNSFTLSLVSDNSIDDEFNVSESGSLNTLLSSSPRYYGTTFQSSESLPRVSGLGISGLTRKEGSGPFDGLGIISIKSSAWRHDDLPSEIRDNIDLSDSIQGFQPHPSSFSSEDCSHSSLVVGDRISNVFLQETLLTFTKDPFHELCHSNTVSSSLIPNCGDKSWPSELDLDESEPGSTSELMNTSASHSTKNSQPSTRVVFNNARRIRKLNTNFYSPTISSGLKQSSTVITSKQTWRNRSSSWPSSTAGDNAATPRLSRCKWRL